ncbi:zinc-finger multi-pass transmembrane protein [Leptomonas pyrrhocoris]|uniref:Palmitoyltransferase n=1 Tax=Leptomonas pyrrhocoris TaxID=157538 RepID=A0A0M9FZU7_LEPPY|nr:zinc-finger multi-pass transmembrane protein [Leptomonas pyrrhocoris]KPA79363.1 zinc-finger multi-pass transmembrane protein [Leptomonas pyrrhocoris]|eukprot:XP_015657802.1 zinc-finger multi-pass transmembrane protein [Leptomonas pyrrhocoris]
MATVEEVLTSWGAVYVALFLPAILMLANFVFGRCFVSEALSRAQHAPQSVHTRSRIVGRAHVAVVALSFAWQFYVVMFVARLHVVGGSDNVHACNPAFFVWDVVDSLPWEGSARTDLLLQCSASDIAYLTSVTLFAILYASCVFSVPQLSHSEPVPKEAAAETIVAVSHCRKCGADIFQMDHHCYFICNCVGKRNWLTFILCLIAGVVNLSYLLCNYLVWVLTEGDALTNLGALLVVVCDVFLVALLCFQVLLWRRGWSTKEFLKVRSRDNESVYRSARRLLF